MNVDEAADLLWQAHQSRIAIAPLSDTFSEMSIDEAYQVQKRNTIRKLAAGGRLVGHKIGLTSPVVQRQLGVDQPDFGDLMADMACTSGAEISMEELIEPKAEAEICLVLKRDLDKTIHTVADIIAAVDYVLPAIEVVDSRINDWKIKITDTIADNASSAFFVLGTVPVKLTDFDHLLCGMSLKKNGEVESTGAGMACLGNPLNAAVWLANKLVEMDSPLTAGDIILTGALGPMVNVAKGDYIEANISGVGPVSVRFR
jgi:2-keto-4-pentenoate hydratase